MAWWRSRTAMTLKRLDIQASVAHRSALVSCVSQSISYYHFRASPIVLFCLYHHTHSALDGQFCIRQKSSTKATIMLSLKSSVPGSRLFSSPRGASSHISSSCLSKKPAVIQHSCPGFSGNLHSIEISFKRFYANTVFEKPPRKVAFKKVHGC